MTAPIANNSAATQNPPATQKELLRSGSQSTIVEGNTTIETSTSQLSYTTPSVSVSLSSYSQRISVSAPAEVQTVTPTSSAEPPAAIAPKSGATLSPEKAADNILSFVEGRVQALADKGASEKKIDRALSAAERGFARGFDQAAKRLEQAGEFNPAQQERLIVIEDRFEAGIAALRERFLSPESAPLEGEIAEGETVEEPVADIENTGAADDSAPVQSSDAEKTPVVSNADGAVERKQSTSTEQDIFQPIRRKRSQSASDLPQLFSSNYRASAGESVQRYGEAFSRSESISLQLTTQDGDTVSVNFYALNQAQAQFGGLFSESGGFSASESQVLSTSNLLVQVDGELDDDEYLALQDLMLKLGEISDAFFAGEDAQELAASILELEFDTEEIAGFNFNAQLQESYQYIEQYRQVAALPTDNLLAAGEGFGDSLPSSSLAELIRSLTQPLAFEQQFVDELLAISLAAGEASDGESTENQPEVLVS